MKKERPIIVGVGELLWDMLPTGKRAGGAPVNLVFHATQLGAQGYAISAVGKDALGDELLKVMDEQSIKYIVPRVDYPTGTVQVTLKEGSPSYDIVEDVAWDYIPVTDEAKEMVTKADAIAYGTLALRNRMSHESICTLLRSAPKDALKYYDINLRQDYYSLDLIEELLQLSNILKINDEELEVLVPMFGLEGKSHNEIARWFIQKYELHYFILTAGGDFSSIYSPKEESYIETPRVKVADTVGAGDSFSGAFLYSILKGDTMRQAHQKAVEVGAFVCTNSGAWPEHLHSEDFV